MDFGELSRNRVRYCADADKVLAQEIEEAQNAYAVQRLLGNSHTAWDIKEKLTSDLRQAKAELNGELKALSERRRSVLNALELAEQPINWPLWPGLGHMTHEDVVDDAMRNHRERYQDKLTRLKEKKQRANAS